MACESFIGATQRGLKTPAHFAFLGIIILLALALGLTNTSADGAEPSSFLEKISAAGYERSEHMIPMRDGTKLYTVVYAPRDKSVGYPILLLRTAYSTDAWVMNPYSHSIGPSSLFDQDGYIFVYQDMRGLFKSEGTHLLGGVFMPHKQGPNDVDESTDAFDTIEWLIHNVPGNNGRVGQWGISAGGRTTVFGMIDAHPALVAASPQAAPADYFIGDDVYHNGALRLAYMFGFLLQNAPPDPKKGKEPVDVSAYRAARWSYDFYLRAGSVSALNELYLHGASEAWSDVVQHDTYDDYWKTRNTAQYLSDVTLPVLNVGGWFDAENFFGTMAHYKAIEEQNRENQSTLIVGPWNHAGWHYLDGDRYGDIRFEKKTAVFFREQVMFPFFRHFLKGEGEWSMPEILAFNTGANQWRKSEQWPPKGIQQRSFYLSEDGRITFDAPSGSDEEAVDTYVSDPAHPVPFTTEIRRGMGGRWIVEDQRLMSTRPDVLTYVSDPLKEEITIAGEIGAQLYVSTTGTDADWIVKLIDVYPDSAPDNPEEKDKNRDFVQVTRMGGYQMLLSSEIMRGKYREDLSSTMPMQPGKITKIDFALPDRLHTFKAGHRIMVQIQSSWFPLYDRNPQKFMPIKDATRSDFQSATHKLFRSGQHPSHIKVDILSASMLEAATFDDGQD